jgi:ankyrin repeat protein
LQSWREGFLFPIFLNWLYSIKVAEIRSAVVNEVNELGDTALSTAAERGHLEVVKELLKYTTKDAISHKNRSGLDPLHLAASNGHQGSIIIHFFCP